MSTTPSIPSLEPSSNDPAVPETSAQLLFPMRRRRRALGITAAGLVCAGLATTGVLAANSASASSATGAARHASSAAAHPSLPAPPGRRAGAKPPTPKPTIDGKITSVSGDTVTVTDVQGFTRTVAVSSSTTYTRNGSTSDAAAMTAGEYIHALGTVDSNGTTLDATSVTLSTKALPAPGLPGSGLPGPGGGPGTAPKAPNGAGPKSPNGAGPKHGSMPKPPAA